MLALLEATRVEIFPRGRIKRDPRKYDSQKLCINRRHGKVIDDLSDIGRLQGM